jgi:hypothetical protein
MCFKVLPWQPRPVFTGVSEYTLDSEGYIIRQQDYWDSINLEKGKYSAKGKLTGLSDFAAQLKKVSSTSFILIPACHPGILCLCTIHEHSVFATQFSLSVSVNVQQRCFNFCSLCSSETVVPSLNFRSDVTCCTAAGRRSSRCNTRRAAI